ncbi:MAG: 5-oxoprolinase subunit PxpB [Gemmatimonadaceae bacterium]|nr:5-oxoprolinase subunit PxpB [Gemmatimonadaceae bacterium]
MHLLPLGDKAFLIELGGGMTAETLSRVRAAIARLDAAAIDGVTDVVAGYSSIAVHFEPLVARRAAMEVMLREALQVHIDVAVTATERIVEVPVRYGGEGGPDLDLVATHHGMSADDVIALHTAPTYTVHMIGFVPGFPYLGGLDPQLATPRRETPRTAVPAGSVGIGGAQTGVYPMESPGGWQLIGHTETKLFDVARAAPSLLRVGDRVRFVAVGR